MKIRERRENNNTLLLLKTVTNVTHTTLLQTTKKGIIIMLFVHITHLLKYNWDLMKILKYPLTNFIYKFLKINTIPYFIFSLTKTNNINFIPQAEKFISLDRLR